jgi:uncharacterized protein (TIGR02996 family)
MSAIPDLEAHLREQPDDWQSWLVYADWLTDRDDPRGQLIGLEHQLATRTDLAKRERERLDRQARRLVRENRWRGAWPLKRRRGYLSWQHGFPWSASLYGGSAARALALALEQAPSQFLCSLDFYGLLAKDVPPLLEVLRRTHAHTLHFHWAELEPEDLASLWGAVSLRHLQLSGIVSELERLEGLLGETLGGLRSLMLDGSTTEAGLATMVRALGSAPLRSLSVLEAELGPALAELLASSPALSRLSRLELTTNGLGDSGAAALARGQTLRSVSELLLHDISLGPEGVGHLLGAGLEALRQLSLDSNPLGDKGAKRLASCPDLRGLRTLSLHSCGLGCQAAEALARSPHLAGLKELILSFNRIEDRGVLALGKSTTLKGLTSLQLLGNEVSESARERFAALRPDLDVEWLNPSDYDDEEWDEDSEWDEFDEAEE